MAITERGDITVLAKELARAVKGESYYVKIGWKKP
jgi:hypothetical protein